MTVSQMTRQEALMDKLVVDELPKDEVFFYNPQVTIVAEGIVFRAPLDALWLSDHFITTFALPAEDTPLTECEAKLLLVRLDDVTSAELRGFLKLLLHVPLGRTERSTSEDELVSALKLAHLWQFQAVHSEAVKRLEAHNLSSAHKIQLAQIYSVPTWYGMEICHLALRAGGLSIEEAERVGLATTQLIGSLRDARWMALQKVKETEGPGLVATKNLVELIDGMGSIKVSDMVIEHCKARENPTSYFCAINGINERKEAFIETVKQVRIRMEKDVQAHEAKLRAKDEEIKSLRDTTPKASAQPSGEPKTNTFSAFGASTSASTALPFGIPHGQTPSNFAPKSLFSFSTSPSTPSSATAFSPTQSQSGPTANSSASPFGKK